MVSVMNQTSMPRLETAIRSILAPHLREDGFSGSGRTFRRVRNSWIQVVHVQGSRSGGSFAINLAIHPLDILDVRDEAPDPKTITDDLCEFRRRLAETDMDQWWEHQASVDSMNCAMTEAARVYARVGRPQLDTICGSESPMHRVRAVDLKEGSFDFLGFESTSVRMALALSRLRKSEGRLDESKAFACYGLANLGRAIGLRDELTVLADSP
jgi:Domain of unknown function (DUF4304)